MAQRVEMEVNYKWIYIALIILLQGTLASAQILNIQKRSPKYDYRPLHFGFEIGFNYIDFDIQPIETLQSLPGLYSIESADRPGITLLLISDLRIGEHLNLRFTPGISYTQRDLFYRITDPFSGTIFETFKQVESTFIEFPLLMKFKSVRVNNYRAYLLTGVKFMLDMASQEKVDDPDLLRIIKSDLSYEFGVGFDFYFDYFKFSPQIKTSFGINNVLVNDGTIYTAGIDQLQTRAVLISFCFE